METELISGRDTNRVVIRTYMLRMLALSQESTKFNLMHPLQELDGYFSKLLHVHEIKQSHIYELTNSDIKSDQHCLLVMTLLYDLAKWVIDTVGDATAVCRYTNYHNTNGYFSMPELYHCPIEPTTVQCIINQSMSITKGEKKHQTLISKNNQLIRILMQLIPNYLPVAIIKSQPHTNCNPESNQHHIGISNSHEVVGRMYSYYTKLYDLMKANKDSNNTMAKQDLKKNYNRAVQTSIKSLGNVVTLIILQTPPPQHLQLQPLKIPHIQLLLQMMQQILKYLEYIYNRIAEELYCVIEILNTVVLNNAGNVGALNINNTVVPKQVVNSFSGEVSAVYGNNFGEVLLSRLKVLRLVLDVVGVISSIQLVKQLLPHSKDSHTKHNTQAAELLNKLDYNQHILHKSSHILIQVNGYVKNSNYYLMGIVFSIYEKMMKLLLNRNTVVPLYLYTHVVINNLKLLMEWSHCTISFNKPATPNSINNNGLLLIPNLHMHLSAYMGSFLQVQPQQFNQLVLLETILTQMSNIFNQKQLEYFLKLYDWNFMEEDICLTSIKYLYEFIENSDNQTKPGYDLFKKCLTLINKKIEAFLQSNISAINAQKVAQESKPEKKQEKFSASVFVAAKKQRKQFYDLKKKQYLHIVEKINKKPKDLFKVIHEFSANGQKEMKDDYIQKCVRIMKKSNHIEQRAMLDFMGAPTPESQELLEKYIETFFKPNSQKNATPASSSVEHLLRYIISNFFLAGEAQQIVRFIDKVTLEYFRHQTATTNLFKNSDSVYTFANAIILLNADQHNPKNPNRMSLQSFMKMCQKINAGEALPVEVIKQTYRNIRQSEIHTFRNRYSIEKISLECWLDLVNDYATVGVDYYDEQMAEICAEGEDINHNSIGFKEFANQLLLSVIDEKETQKLEAMIERFEYDDRKFDCEIIEKIRQMIVNKKHIAMHALQKIYEEADFRNKKIDEKMLSYCWLASGIIQTFPDTLPFSKIAEYLLRTWKVGFEVKDNLLIRQNLQLKTIRKCIKQHKKKQSKKSIMEMFSKFLSSKESQNEDDPEIESPTQITSNNRKKANIANCSFNVLKLLMKSKDSRARAAQAVLFSLRHEQSRRFEQFFACLYLIFHFVFGDGNFETDVEEENTDNSINMDGLKILLNLLDDFYCISQPHQIGSRITSLKTKNFQKYELVYAYAQFWTLKILLSFSVHHFKIRKQEKPEQEQKIKLILSKCEDLFSIINPELLQQIVDIVDLEGLNFEQMPQKLHITKELCTQLRLASKNHSIQLKNLSVKDTQSQKPNISLKKTESIEKKQQPIKENQKLPEKIQQVKQHQKPKNLENVKQNLVKKQSEQNIEQALKKQLGFVAEDKKEIADQVQEQKPIEKVEQKQQNLQQQKQGTANKTVIIAKTEEVKDDGGEKQENLNIGGGQDKLQEQKKSVKSSESGEEIGLPIYML